MKVLGIGGCSSGVGKTTLICRVLEALPGWGALKTTPVHKKPCPDPDRCAACHGLRGDYRVLTESGRLFREGSDTWRYRESGAVRVAWLKSRPECIGLGVDEAVKRFRDLPGVVVEGNSFTRYLWPDRMVLVARLDLEEVKPSARSLLARADLVALNGSPGTVEDRRDLWLRRLAEEYGARRIVELDASSPDHPGTRAFLEEIRDQIGVKS
jgi:molybdopterin-guanine dinucleotide biosynthesis protein